jgi:hypothetical protein
LAGAVFVHHQQGLGIQPYATEESLAVFTMVVIGGLGSLPGAVLGAVYVYGAEYFLPTELSFFVGGIGLLLVLLALPDGLGWLLYQGRDALLRQVATRRKIMVPSLFADAASIDSVGLSKERGLAFLREVADRIEQGAPVPIPGMEVGRAVGVGMAVEPPPAVSPSNGARPDAADPAGEQDAGEQVAKAAGAAGVEAAEQDATQTSEARP